MVTPSFSSNLWNSDLDQPRANSILGEVLKNKLHIPCFCDILSFKYFGSNGKLIAPIIDDILKLIAQYPELMT